MKILKLTLITIIAFVLAACAADQEPWAEIRNPIIQENIITFDVYTEDPDERIEVYEIRLVEQILYGDIIDTFGDADGIITDGTNHDVSFFVPEPGLYEIQVYAEYEIAGEEVAEVITFYEFELTGETTTEPFAEMTDIVVSATDITFELTVYEHDGWMTELRVLVTDELDQWVFELTKDEDGLHTNGYTEITIPDLEPDTAYTIEVIADYDFLEETYTDEVLITYTFTTLEE